MIKNQPDLFSLKPDHAFLNVGLTKSGGLYASACSPKKPRIESRLNIALKRNLAANEGKRGFTDVCARISGRNVVFKRNDFYARINLDELTGKASVARNEYSVNSLLRVIFSWLAPQAGGLLMHSSGIKAGNKSFIFTGISGSGKSTIIKEIKKIHGGGRIDILSDEIVLVESSKYNKARAYGTPFWGELSGLRKENNRGNAGGSAAAKLFFLRKAPFFKIKPLGKAEAMTRMLPNVLYFLKNKAAADMIMSLALEIAGNIPCFELFFMPRMTKKQYEAITE